MLIKKILARASSAEWICLNVPLMRVSSSSIILFCMCDVEVMIIYALLILQVIRLHEEFFLPGEVIMEQGNVVDQLYFVCHGVLV